MEQTITFTQDEISEITKLQTDFNELISEFGRFSIRKLEILEALGLEESGLQSKLVSIKKLEEEYSDKILKKYGEGTFDISTGKFVPKAI